MAVIRFRRRPKFRASPVDVVVQCTLAVLLFIVVLLMVATALPRAELLHAVSSAKSVLDALVDGIRPAMEQVAERAKRVIDGDTLVVGSKRIRLFGIDAPESKQRCRAAGRSWPCGREATRALASRVGRYSVICDARTRDDYGRIVAVCRSGGTDLNRWMVARGWALAYRRYSRDYVAAERMARSSRRGMWRGEFVPPWEWRRG